MSSFEYSLKQKLLQILPNLRIWSVPAGTVPFKSDSILGLYNEICNTPLTFPEHIFVSDSMKHLLLRLLDKDPENRISLTSAMCHQWVTHNGAYPLDNIQASL